MKKNVVVTMFNVESEAYQVLSELKSNPGTEEYLVLSAALVKKENGKCEMLDGFDTGAATSNDTLKGGLIGTAIGILGGPLGMLLGATYGALIGMTVDSVDAKQGLSMLEMVASKMDEGTMALIAMTDEENEKALDDRLSAFDAMIIRFDAERVAEEVEKAEETQKEMARLARLELRNEKQAKEAEAHADTLENYKARHQGE